MLHEVIEGLTASIATIDEGTDQWACLGLVDTREEVVQVQDALGPRYEVMSEPFDENIALAGGHPWIRGATSWEVWARFR
jgi:hypothetical protein